MEESNSEQNSETKEKLLEERQILTEKIREIDEKLSEISKKEFQLNQSSSSNYEIVYPSLGSFNQTVRESNRSLTGGFHSRTLQYSNLEKIHKCRKNYLQLKQSINKRREAIEKKKLRVQNLKNSHSQLITESLR